MAGKFSIADITLVSILVSFNYGGKRIDSGQFPNLDGYFSFLLDKEPVKSVLEAERPAAESVPGFDTTFRMNSSTPGIDQ